MIPWVAYSIAGFFLAFFNPGFRISADANPPSPAGRRVEHALRIVHPGDAAAKPMPHTVVQELDRDGDPIAYSMWVDSVICRETTCDVVKVQLHWDALGRYQNYQVAPGSKLTKLDHVPFTREELARLQEILKDPDSPLKEVEKEAMTAKIPAKTDPLHELPDGVDAISRPTILTLKTAVILGAGYTCYDLWHWSNGLLTGHIRDFTARDSSRKRILRYLTNEDDHSALFALESLKKRKISDPSVVDAVIARSKKGPPTLTEATLGYLKEAAASDQIYYDALTDLFSEPNSKKRLLILESLMSENQSPVAGFYDQLSDDVPGLESYFETHLFLNLVEKHEAASATIARKTAELLSHKKFFISRRAYRYLQQQRLPADVQELVDAYRAQHKERL